MTSLELLTFQYNDFTGPVPSSFSQLSNLQELSFWNNDMTGTVPNGVCDISSLQTFVLDCLEVETDCWTRCYYQCDGVNVPCPSDGGGGGGGGGGNRNRGNNP